MFVQRTWRILGFGLAILTLGFWWLTYDVSNADRAVLGGYRDRWFMLGLGLTWVTLLSFMAVFNRRRKLWFGIIAIHMGVGIPLISLELAAAVGFLDFRSVVSRNRTYFFPGPQAVRYRQAPNQSYEGTALGDLTDVLGAPPRIYSVSFETDGRGLREPLGKTQPKIVFLGDSILVAGKLQLSERVSERLEAELGVEILNVSASGYSPQEELNLLQQLNLKMSGLLVVHFIFEGNDLVDSRRWREWSRRSSNYPNSGLLKVLLRTLDRPRRSVGTRRVGSYKGASGNREDVFFLYDGKRTDDSIGEFDHLSADLAAGHRALRQRGATTVIVFVPSKLSVMGEYVDWPKGSTLSDPRMWSSTFSGRLRAFAVSENVEFFDLTPPLKTAATEGLLPYFTDDTHMNSLGHSLASKAMAPWLRPMVDRM